MKNERQPNFRAIKAFSGGDVVRSILPVLNFAAIACSLFAIFSCSFLSYKPLGDDSFLVEVVNTIGGWLGREPIDDPAFGVGLFTYEPSLGNSSLCANFNIGNFSDFQNEMTQEPNPLGFYLVARYCSLVAPAFGILAFLISLFGLCCSLQMWCNKIMSFFYVVATLSQMGTFSAIFRASDVYDNGIVSCFSNKGDFTCEMGQGAWLSVASSILYFILIFVPCWLIFLPCWSASPRPIRKEDAGNKGQDTDESDDENGLRTVPMGEAVESERKIENNSAESDDENGLRTVPMGEAVESERKIENNSAEDERKIENNSAEDPVESKAADTAGATIVDPIVAVPVAAAVVATAVSAGVSDHDQETLMGLEMQKDLDRMVSTTGFGTETVEELDAEPVLPLSDLCNMNC